MAFTERPTSPINVNVSKTSSAEDTDILSPSDDVKTREVAQSFSMSPDQINVFFDNIVETIRDRASLRDIDIQKDVVRRTKGGFVINRTLLLRLNIDSKNYMTIPIKQTTTAKDALNKVILRRNIPKSTQCKLYQDDQEIDDNANLYEIMQISSGNQIQIRFLNKKLSSTASHSYSSNDDDNKQKDLRSPPPSSPYTTRTPSKSQRGKPKLPPKLNLQAYASFQITQDKDSKRKRESVSNVIQRTLSDLPTEEFYVIKINKYNKKQKRLLRLTKEGIENVQLKKSFFTSSENENISSSHFWKNVTNSYLEDSKTIKISYKDYKDGDRKYQSNEANAINEAIHRRLKMIRDKKTTAARQEISAKFQKKLMNKQITMAKVFHVFDHVRLTRNRTGLIVYKGCVHFAPSEHYGIALDKANGDHDGYFGGIRYFKTETNKGVLVPESHIVRKIRKTSTKMENENDGMGNGMSLDDIGSPFTNGALSDSLRNGNGNRNKNNKNGDRIVEDVIFKEMKRRILSSDTIEGKYRINFDKQFHKYIKEPNLLEMVRELMDSVKRKILKKHERKYKEMIRKSWNKKHNKNMLRDGDGYGDNDDVMDEMKLDSLNTKKEKMLKQANEQMLITSTLNKLVECAIEQTILQIKIKQIYKICLEKTQSEMGVLKQRIEKLRCRSQQFFGIKKQLKSSTNWNRAVYELSLLKYCSLPSEKINALVNCAHAIYLSHSKEQKEKEKTIHVFKKEQYFITGDDFLPIAIYVVIQASTKTKPAITDADLLFMEGLVDPAANRSEPGYYLAVFHAALQWIRCFNN